MNIIDWLLEGDVSIQYQTYRDLLNQDRPELKNRIKSEGFGKRLLDLQKPDGHWSEGYYLYKWISTHYTLLELRRLEVEKLPRIDNIIQGLIKNYKVQDGGITANPERWDFSDICLNGMLLFVFCYFKTDEPGLISMIDRILKDQLPDGGFNCDADRFDVHHSSLHSTISIIEGFNEYIGNDYDYRVDEVIKARNKAIEFILMHQLFISDRTGEIINPNFIKLSYPPRYKYDILRALEAFRVAGIDYDERMEEAFKVIDKKRRKDGSWPVQNKHSGKVHFDMEKMGGPSRWNTLRVLRVLKHFKSKEYLEIVDK